MDKIKVWPSCSGQALAVKPRLKNNSRISKELMLKEEKRWTEVLILIEESKSIVCYPVRPDHSGKLV